jgi:phage/plasmid-like protein (TIGR03299 family)
MSILKTVGNTVTNNILTDAGLDWNVALSNGISAEVPESFSHAKTSNKCATVRTDTNEILGIVSPDYKVVQNAELAWMAERVAGSNLTVDTGGELKGGGRVWLSVNAPSFSVGNSNDEVHPFLLLTNGHDGLFSLSATPTSVRTWCENTLNMALAQGRKENMCISLRHKGNMQEKMEDLMTALEMFYKRSADFRTQADYLAKSKVDTATVANYFRLIYSDHVDVIPEEVTTKEEDRKMNKFHNTLQKWWNTFDDESYSLGSNMWIAFNSVTNWVDHGSSFRGVNKNENKFLSNFYGKSASLKQNILDSTLTYA